MESKDHIRTTNPDELLNTQHDQLQKDGEANDLELDFDHMVTLDDNNADAIDKSDAIDASELTDAREFDATLLDTESDENYNGDLIDKANWGDVDPLSTPGASRSGMDPSGPSSGVL